MSQQDDTIQNLDPRDIVSSVSDIQKTAELTKKPLNSQTLIALVELSEILEPIYKRMMEKRKQIT